MLHELGHALGLEHQDNRLATMNTHYYNSGPNGHYNTVEPHADDRQGIRLLYPNSTTERDIAVSRYHNTGSTTAKNTLFTTNNSPVYVLNKGGQYDLQYTMENLGTEAESVTIHFYISTDSYISTNDIYLGSTTWSMPAPSYLTATKRITIPTSLSSGTYYRIGYIADPNNVIPESSTSNNFVSLIDSYRVN